MSIASSSINRAPLGVRGGSSSSSSSSAAAGRGFLQRKHVSSGGGARRGGSKQRRAMLPRAVEEDEGELVESEPKWRDNTEDALESIIIEPRMTFGLDVHRRVHADAMKQMAYQAQWRAYCERAKRDWRDAVTDEDETVLCSFQYEMEQGLERFEEAKAAGELNSWPPRTLHPTQGLPAIDAALKARTKEGGCWGEGMGTNTHILCAPHTYPSPLIP